MYRSNLYVNNLAKDDELFTNNSAAGTTTSFMKAKTITKAKHRSNMLKQIRS